jgi:hypothetical protein
MTRSPAEIVKAFKASGFQHMHDILGNRVFYTDSTSSTLVWYEGCVVIEYYILHPNVEVPMHWHPFENQIIFISGELTGFVESLDTVKQKSFTTDDCLDIGAILPIGHKHGFKTGSTGAVIYNIQIWPNTVTNPLSASIEYLGPSMGPLHQQIRYD